MRSRVAFCWLCLAALASGARAEEEAPAGLAALLDALPAPTASPGFHVRGIQQVEQGGRRLELHATMSAFPGREGEQAVWVLRQKMRRPPLDSVEESVIGSDHRPIQGTARSRQGSQEQLLSWHVEGDHVLYEVTDAAGRTQSGRERMLGPTLCNGAGLVLFLRQLRPRTGTYDFSLLAPDLIVQVGLVDMTLTVAEREHDGQPAYVGEAELPGAMRVRVVLDAETGALRALETEIVPTQLRGHLTDLRDEGVAAVHNQSAARLEEQGALEAALVEAEAARAAGPEDSGYALRVGAIHRKLAQETSDEAQRVAHHLEAGLVTSEAARLIGEELRTGRLAQDDAASFQALQAGLYELAGNDLLEVLASDPQAQTILGHERSALEVAMVEALVAWALLTATDQERALVFAGEVAQGLVGQNAARQSPATPRLAALAAQVLEALAQRRPREAGVWENLGAMRYRAGDDGGAITALERCLQIQPKSPTARAYYGAALWRSGRRAEARQQLAILERVGALQQAVFLRLRMD